MKVIISRSIMPGAQNEFDLKAVTIFEAICKIDSIVPGFKSRVLRAGSESLRSSIQVFVNGAQPQSILAPIQQDASVEFEVAIRGG